MSKTRKLATVGAAGALGIGVLLAAPALAQEGDVPEPGTEKHEKGLGHKRGQRSEERRAALAEHLGISVEDLAAASQDAVDQLGEVDRQNFDPEQKEARKQAFQEALAARLGIGVEDLDGAREAAFSAGVKERVTNGDLTQEEADEMIAAYKDGTLRDLKRSKKADRLAGRLAEAVDNGSISREQADEVSQAAEAGTLREYMEQRREAGEPPLAIGPGRPGGPGRGGPGPGGPPADGEAEGEPSGFERGRRFGSGGPFGQNQPRQKAPVEESTASV